LRPFLTLKSRKEEKEIVKHKTSLSEDWRFFEKERIEKERIREKLVLSLVKSVWERPWRSLSAADFRN
jgi:hypothetical protein